MENLFEQTLEKIVADDHLHAKLLNTLSLMENVGARKISKYEHPVNVNLTILKHAAEEARHAFYLKKQIGKLGEDLCPDYNFEYLLAPVVSYQYLHQLDAKACRYLYNRGLKGRSMHDAAYILVTYAIEVRADSLYDTYQKVLTANDSKVNVKSIILEEAGHLEEMTRMLKEFDDNWQPIAEDVCKIEDELHQQWIKGLAKTVGLN
ncbi:MAG TPA: hypothetical protein VFQ86_07650 [Arachidicoccus soli]|uniref:Ferritin-like domain-containing protein n=1 Tax=Arachidicoccus soli TaxID=2341117 RepID=A0A386HPN5_9BACT|nr:hypothetical protein [Arachidicoccus soli]AYD47805.1 hypothetical protein D6B99_09510 [Arachidicoccus soli]HEU0227595.1 hypothetical protein [Arachidicoccus soli]